MKKEFVPYELAVKLKALGFDEPCLFAFDNCSTPMRCSDLRTSEQKFNGVNYNSSSYTSQPTVSQAFRWFREKYGLFASFVEYTNDILPEIYYMFTITGGDHYEDFNTYEEAELACIDKLIEIVKSKSE